MAEWYFRPKQPGEQNREPIHSEFFASDAISEPGKALVREGIQNSLDASLRNGSPVMVRIYLSGTERQIPPDMHSVFFNGSWPHFNAERNGLEASSRPSADDPCPFIVFEDMNTEGLTGDLTEPFQPDPGIENHFYHFFRAEGQSDKGASKRGSWGVGKTVFLRSSRLSSVIGLTVREDDGQRILMGKSVLRSHRVDDLNYQDGYLGVPPESEGVVLPIKDDATLDQFCEIFGIERGSKETGLSLMIPWYDQEITEHEIIRSVLKDYFYPILDGQLEVIIETPSYEALLGKNTLLEQVEELGEEFSADLSPLIQLAQWAQAVVDEERIVLNEPTGVRAWKWSSAIVPAGAMDQMRESLDKGDRLAVRVPVSVKPKSGDPRATYFDMYFERSFDDERGRPTFIREGIIIAEVKSSRSRGVRAIVVASDEAIAEFLRDAENPSHTDWNHSRLKDKYRYGFRSDLDFVKNCVYELVRIVSTEEREEDKKLLADVFSIPAPPDDEAPEPRPDPKPTPEPGDGPDDPPQPPPPPQKKRFHLSRRAGGFSVTKGDDDAAVPESIVIRAAYDIRRGNPIKRYNPADFNLNKAPIRLEPDPTGLDITEIADNRIVAKVTARDFSIHVIGFDPKRQLFVKVTATGADDGNS